jgi:orotate phosphoribosyltransferase
MMSDKVIQIFKDAGALQEGHFLLTSGLHSPVYWEKFRVLQFPHLTEKLCHLIAEHFTKQNIEVVAGPTTGGIILAFEVARLMGVKSIFAEKEGEKRIFRRSLTLNPGERTLIVDDVLTTGGSINEVIAAVKLLNGNIIGIGVLVDRSQQGIKFDVPLFSCICSPAVTYKPIECPLCAAGIPLTKPGGGA